MYINPVFEMPDISRAQSVEPNETPAMVRHERAGQVSVHVHRSGGRYALTLKPNATIAHLVVPLTGIVLMSAGGEVDHAEPGKAVLLARHERVECACPDPSSFLVFDFPRTLLQGVVTRLFAQPRRLAAVRHALVPDGRLAAAIEMARRVFEGQGAAVMPEDAVLAEALVAALHRAEADLFPVSRSLQRASDYLLANPEAHCTAEELATIAGVALRTLRLNVKTCLGISLASFIERVRLGWVRERLTSPMECRSITQLAQVCGYSNPRTLARRFQRCFGETPTQVRARAFATIRNEYHRSGPN